ncbi:nematocyst expressed protein 3-like [Cydia amplana]|uniref:nematocyst expressed protein 3-like n=1 Tax=Cydia amplana TaxID=1869771 RepID=UPI002FE55AB0
MPKRKSRSEEERWMKKIRKYEAKLRRNSSRITYSSDEEFLQDEPPPPPQNLQNAGLDEQLGVSAEAPEDPPGPRDPEPVPGPSSASLPVEPAPGASSAPEPLEPVVQAEATPAPEQIEPELIDPELLQALGPFEFDFSFKLEGPTALLFSAQCKNAAEPQRLAASRPAPADVGAAIDHVARGARAALSPLHGARIAPTLDVERDSSNTSTPFPGCK